MVRREYRSSGDVRLSGRAEVMAVRARRDSTAATRRRASERGRLRREPQRPVVPLFGKLVADHVKLHVHPGVGGGIWLPGIFIRFVAIVSFVAAVALAVAALWRVLLKL